MELNENQTPKAMNFKDASKYTGFSVYSLRKGVKEGRIPHVKVGVKVFILVDQYIKMLEKESVNNLIN